MVISNATEQDLIHLQSLLIELHNAGREDEAQSVARAYSVLQASVHGEDFEGDEDDPEFVESMRQADEDVKAGRLKPHDEVAHRLLAPDDAKR